MCLIYENLQEYERAVKYGEKAIDILEKTAGKESDEYQTAVENLRIAMKNK